MPPPPRPLRVLFADDDAVVRELMRGVLGAAGALVRCAENGAAALREARTFRPDLVLLDLAMPVMDGITACRLLRADPALGGVPIHFVSSRTRSSDRLAAERAGASGFIAKPFTGDALRDVLRSLPVATA